MFGLYLKLTIARLDTLAYSYNEPSLVSNKHVPFLTSGKMYFTHSLLLHFIAGNSLNRDCLNLFMIIKRLTHCEPTLGQGVEPCLHHLAVEEIPTCPLKYYHIEVEAIVTIPRLLPIYD